MFKLSHNLFVLFFTGSLLQVSCSKMLESLNTDSSQERRFSAKDYSLERNFRVFSRNFLSEDIDFINHVGQKDSEQSKLIKQFRNDWHSYLRQVGGGIPIVAQNAGVLPSAERVAEYYASWKEGGGSAFKVLNPYALLSGQKMPSGSLNGLWYGSEATVPQSSISKMINFSVEKNGEDSPGVTYNSMSVLPVSGFLFDVGYVPNADATLSKVERWNEWMFTLQCAKANVTVGAQAAQEKIWALFFGKYDKVIDTARYSGSFGTFYSLLRKNIQHRGGTLQVTPPDSFMVYSIQESKYSFSFVKLDSTLSSRLGTPRELDGKTYFGFAFPGYSLNFYKESLNDFYSLLNVNRFDSSASDRRIEHYYTISHDAGSFARVYFHQPVSDSGTFPRILESHDLHTWLVEGEFREAQPAAGKNYSSFYTWTEELGWKPLPEVIGKQRDFSEFGLLNLSFNKQNLVNFLGVPIHAPGAFNHASYANIQLSRGSSKGGNEALLFLETEKFSNRSEPGKDIGYYADKICKNIYDRL